ncbi:MAG: hypothetical protein ACT4N8_01105 [Sphingosinicella sp.]|uniref:hypothetical protein n=1 Tax=Sphingosinicella sp. TaxID=1917971 RepID=UPI004037C4A3
MRILSAVTALALIAGSSAAAAQTAQSLSLSNAPAIERAGAPVGDASELDGRRGVGIYIIGAIALGLIIWGIIELTKSDDSPASP